MKQITQKDLIKLIEDKQENAMNMFYSTRDSEERFGEAPLKKARCLAEMDAYQDLICYIKSVQIVPEIPEIKQEDLENKTDIKVKAWDNLENLFHIYIETTPNNTHYLTVAEKEENHIAYTSVEGCATERIVNEEYEIFKKAGLE